MTTYLTIITTVLVLTQIIRLIQNAIQLKSMKETHRLNYKLVKDWNEVLDKFNELIEDMKE